MEPMEPIKRMGPEDHKRLQSMGNRKFVGQDEYRNPMCEQRVGLCIDIQNLYYSAKDLHNAKVNYHKFLNKVANGRKLVKAIAYVANSKGSAPSPFTHLLKNIGCDVRHKNVIEREDGSKKCDWDVEIAVDAMAMANKIDVFVLASGDGDFVYLLRALKSRGVRCEVISFKENTSNALMDETDKFTSIDDSLLISFNKSAEPEKKLILEDANEI